MHSKGYAHRDLKLENIMLDENYRAVITNLDFAEKLDGSEGAFFGGSLSYMAPELF